MALGAVIHETVLPLNLSGGYRSWTGSADCDQDVLIAHFLLVVSRPVPACLPLVPCA